VNQLRAISDIQHATIAMLATKLEIAINKIESAIKTHPIGDQELEVTSTGILPVLGLR
jgi:hypothetical protein